jgi:serine/alanine adding enzyme
MLDRFGELGQRDIYFEHRYVDLYRGAGEEILAFVFRTRGDLFFLPLKKAPLPPTVNADGLSDFETAYGYSGPLCTSDDRQFLESAWGAFIEYCRASGIIAGFIRFNPIIANHRFVDPEVVALKAERSTVYLDLTRTSESIWAEYDSNNRNKIRRSQKRNVTVAEEGGQAALSVFSQIYRRHMTELSAAESYHFGDDYFAAIGDMGPNHYKVYLARHEGEIIGGALILLADRLAHYHLSSSLSAYFDLAPNNLLRHHVTMDLLGKRWEILNFGGGRTNSPTDSLLRFKQSFSRQYQLFYTGSVVADPLAYGKVKAEWMRRRGDAAPKYDERVLCYRFA